MNDEIKETGTFIAPGCPCVLIGCLLNARIKRFFTLKALHKSFTTNYAFKNRIRYTGTFITQGRFMYINWMVVKSRKQTFFFLH